METDLIQFITERTWNMEIGGVQYTWNIFRTINLICI